MIETRTKQDPTLTSMRVEIPTVGKGLVIDLRLARGKLGIEQTIGTRQQNGGPLARLERLSRMRPGVYDVKADLNLRPTTIGEIHQANDI
jgi:hypothetical protein